jgi:tetratricopeptide (TPR) repeat protein
MKLTNAVLILCCSFCLLIDRAYANPTHTVRGVVITADGTVVPEFTITVKHVVQKPELFTRKRFRNGEFTITGLTGDKYQLQISSPLYIATRLNFDFKADPRQTEYSIVILHTYRNEARCLPGAAYTVSLTKLQQKIPDGAREAYLKGVDLHREGHLEEALMEYGQALRAYPNYVEALSDLGSIFILYNRPESALTFLRRAHEIDSGNVIINLNIAIALTEQGDYPEATKLLKKVLSTTPRTALAQYYLAKINYIQKKYDHAEQYVRQASENDPNLLESWLLMINIGLEHNKYEQAREGLLHIRQAMNNKMVSKFIDEQLSTLASLSQTSPVPVRSFSQIQP